MALSLGYDAATDVITRAVGYLDQRTPIAELDAGPQPAPRDLLSDLVVVLGEERLPAADVPALLRDLAPALDRPNSPNSSQFSTGYRSGGDK